MSRIKLNFKRLPLTEKIARARQIVTALTGNADFPTPMPPLIALTTASDEADAAFNEAQQARQTAKEMRFRQLVGGAAQLATVSCLMYR
jgi:hypothetical protein